MSKWFDDNLINVWDNFHDSREKDLFNRFNGWYRAEVVETNDPLISHRIRFRCPEMHDRDVLVEDLPWAVPAPWMGGKGSGSWTHPMIGDIVFVCFEKNHPYGPIWCASGDPTRRKSYPHQAIYGETPAPISERDGAPENSPNEALIDYLPKDGRPYSTGFRDRYGTFFILNSTGFFPEEHRRPPAPLGTDALANRDFDLANEQPIANDPDTKYAAINTKYGNLFILNDVGYNWFKEGDQGEFIGNQESDQDFEIQRSQYLQRLLNENKPRDVPQTLVSSSEERDQRRIELRTRYGHKFEMRDKGWRITRAGEYDPNPRIIAAPSQDERWIKIRTKAGHLFQMIDVGADPTSNLFVKQTNLSEIGAHDAEYGTFKNNDDPRVPELADSEDKRVIRLESAHGNLLWLDDRGSDALDPSKAEPRGNGFLLKSRRGHAVEALDKDEFNRIMLVTASDQVLEMNDRFEYLLMTTAQASNSPDVSPGGRKGYTGASREPGDEGVPTGQSSNPLDNTYHFLMDKANCFIRLRTPEKAGIEIRDGDAPCGTWMELRDNDNRALWFSRRDNFAIWRDGASTKLILIDDNDNSILVDNQLGNIIIRSAGNISLDAAGDICMRAGGRIGLDAGSEIGIATSGITHGIDASGIKTTQEMYADKYNGVVERSLTAVEAKAIGAGPAPTRAGDGLEPCSPDDKTLNRTEPEPFDQERGCDDFKDNKGPVPREVLNSPPGGGGGSGIPSGGGGGGGLGPETPKTPTTPSSNPIDQPGSLPPSDPDPAVDPIAEILGGGGGIVWFGLSSDFEASVLENGLIVQSLANGLQAPPDLDETIDQLQLSRTFQYAEETQAVLSKERYGGSTMIVRIRAVPDPTLLDTDPDNADIIVYKGDIPFDGFLEIYQIKDDTLETVPLFPDLP